MSGWERSDGVRITPSHVRVSRAAARTPITIHAEGPGERPGGAVRCHHTIPNPTTVAMPLMYAAAQHHRNRRRRAASDDTEAARVKRASAIHEIQLVVAAAFAFAVRFSQPIMAAPTSVATTVIVNARTCPLTHMSSSTRWPIFFSTVSTWVSSPVDMFSGRIKVQQGSRPLR